MIDPCDIAIVGAGAAGLAAAIFAAQSQPAPKIILLDGAKVLGAKILVAGGGRCNVTHDAIQPRDFNGSPNIVRNILAAFDCQATVRWFSSLGVELKVEEGGKLFPVSNSAKTVLGALLERCRQLGIGLACEHRVTGLSPPGNAGNDRFTIAHSRGRLSARKVILATGGRSLPRSGSDGYGWQLARQLGHTVSDTYPALVPLLLDDRFFHAKLSGLAQPVELTTLADGKLIDRRTGAMLWTHFGVSGPVVMDASRFYTIGQGRGATVVVRCSLLPGMSAEQLEQWLIDQASANPKLAMEKVLGTQLPNRLAAMLVEFTGLPPQLPAGQLAKPMRAKLVKNLTALELPVIGDRGWNYAEVTAGGVPLVEINYRTMESRKVPGLYLAGEILDCDGRIGGFNFQWAWATGFLAGRAAVS